MATPDAGVPVALTTEDGTRLSARRFPAEVSQARLVIAGATGTPQGFYRRFATYMAGRGYDTLTLDFRGIGDSAPKRLHGYEMSYLDWSWQDLPAALRHHTHPELPLYVVGHSYGGHAIGLLPEDCRVDGFYGFAVGAGSSHWMPLKEKLRVAFMWHVLGPITTRLLGYMPGKALSMGEDLPLGVYHLWKRWCGWPDYFFSDPKMKPHLDGFARRTLPMMFVNALDDLWALPASRNAFVDHYTSAMITRIDLDPAACGPRGIGHMGYFRTHAEPLWTACANWFDRHARATGDKVG